MFKITKGLAIIAFVIVAVAGATYAVYTSDKRIYDNAFVLGTVSEGDTQGFPFSLTNMTPGQTSETGILGIKYTGTIQADMYFGVRAQGGADLRDILEVRIEKFHHDGANWISDGFTYGWQPVNYVFENWTQFANNVNENEWVGGKVYIRVKDTAGNEYQAKSATNQIIIHAVQDGYPPPTTAPWTY